MTSRARARKKSLGAAMAEGAVVLPLLAGFFGIIMYIHHSYEKKVDLQAEARFAAFSNAAHACKAEGEDAATKGGRQRGIDVEVPPEGNAPDASKDLAVETTWLETSANKTGTAVALGRTRKVTAASTVYCNPDIVNATDAPSKLYGFAHHGIGFVSRWSRGTI